MWPGTQCSARIRPPSSDELPASDVSNIDGASNIVRLQVLTDVGSRVPRSRRE
jgi:hypothetical protein